MGQEADLSAMVEAELVSATERLDAALLLLSKGKLADAVNRIYYAAFHAATAALHSRGREPKTHTGLISEFSLWMVKPGLMEPSDFSTLRRSYEARETSDYTVAAVFEEKEVHTLYQEVTSFVAKAAKVARTSVKSLSAV